MAVISFLGGLFPRLPNYVPKKNLSRLKVIHPGEKYSAFEATADGTKAALNVVTNIKVETIIAPMKQSQRSQSSGIT
jgi:hypothetical protein